MLRFKQYNDLQEARKGGKFPKKPVKETQKGFLYEENAAKVLKKYTVDASGNTIVPKNFKPAGAGSKIPDLRIQRLVNNKLETTGCELKISSADAGSLVLKYKGGKWKFDELSSDTKDVDEKRFVIEVATKNDAITKANSSSKWGGKVPYLANKGMDPNTEEIEKEKSGLTGYQMYKRDLDTFGDILGNISATDIETYYNKKNTYYINIGTHGFFLLGSENPLELKGIPRFSTNVKAKYRMRVHPKSGMTAASKEPTKNLTVGYQFTFLMNFVISKRSPYNLAPIMSINPTNVSINTKKLGDMTWFINND